MRQFRAVFLGLWYTYALAVSLVVRVKILARDNFPGLGSHYVLGGLLWACGVGVSSYFAGLRSQKYPVIFGTLSAFLPPLLFALLFMRTSETLEFSYPLEPLAFGWTPTVRTVFFALWAIVLLAGLLGGIGARSELARPSAPYVTNEQQILGVRRKHWLWLWLPMSTWACAVPTAVYLLWLSLAAVWHWVVHPPIWFNWRWYLFFTFGAMTVYLPYALLSTGIKEAWHTLAWGHESGLSAVRVTMRFVKYGYGLAFCGFWIAVLCGEWVLSKLPIASAGKPWWMLF